MSKWMVFYNTVAVATSFSAAIVAGYIAHICFNEGAWMESAKWTGLMLLNGGLGLICMKLIERARKQKGQQK